MPKFMLKGSQSYNKRLFYAHTIYFYQVIETLFFFLLLSRQQNTAFVFCVRFKAEKENKNLIQGTFKGLLTIPCMRVKLRCVLN